MKTITKLYSIILLCFALLISMHSFAKGDNVEKKKTYTKSYNINNNDEISIENQFGETKLVIWSNNEIKVDVEIKTKASRDERAQQLLDAISIEDGKSGDGVYFKTKIDNINKNKKDEHTQMEINYVVHLPANNPLHLKTQFGNTIVPDYNGPAEIEIKFGSLDAGVVTQAKELSVQFGSAKIKSINNCDFTIKYSSFSVNKLSGDIDAKFEFCHNVELNLDDNIKSFDLYNNYSEIKISTVKDLSADFDIETHFGEFSNKSDYDIKEEQKKDNEWRSPRFDYHFMGKSGSGNIKVNVKSNFGKTTII